MMKQRDSDPKSQRNIVFSVSTVIFAALVLVFYVISNLPSISEWLNKILSILSPVITGFAIAYIVNPILRLLERRVLHKIRSSTGRRMLSILLTYLIVAIIISAIALLIIPQLISSFKELIGKFDSYIENAVAYVNNLYNSVAKYIRFGKESAEDEEIISLEAINEMLRNLLSRTGDITNSVFTYLQSYGSKLFSAISDLVLALFISFYVLASKERLLAKARRIGSALFTEKRNRSIREIVVLADSTFGSFLGGKIVDCLVVGIIVYIGFLIAGIPYSAMIATIIGATNIIPFFGPIIGAIPAAFIVFISNPGKLLLFIIIDVVVLQIDGNIIEPKIIGDRTGISSLSVLISISVMGNLWGVIGMIVGVPLFAVGTAMIEKYVSARLHEKGVSNDLDDYFVDEEPPAPLQFKATIKAISPTYYWRIFLYHLRPGKKRGEKPKRDDYRKQFSIQLPRKDAGKTISADPLRSETGDETMQETATAAINPDAEDTAPEAAPAAAENAGLETAESITGGSEADTEDESGNTAPDDGEG